ncbi:hypothetical protein JX265_003164 [Neoarthrinium moseri]|uniref:SnoaL-like domain-containing protein n=1 Tax=Neoarthrinium moseri TaxID=1658444 RepID=A0A9P9WTD1_9PEZI|nr:uncharacterized protein JN550_005600 [Neoarthrinium moseri]KAI1852675.1 hypothetical protein JX266_002216 [Neoarthrinium moseri]KAI1870010.1 hypothetical protein JN550_005600 [Neoarthrinium moseri]KAI1878987.1 hypothetical protein JX265_003164 [Neoarthrinium moseri]
MNIDVPGIVEAALPKGQKGKRNVAVIADNMNGPNHNDPGFLSDDFPKNPPKLFITSDDEEFDVGIVNAWREEGFQVEYLAMGAGGKEYRMKLDGLRQTGFGPCETYGIVAFGEAASICLEHFHILDNNPDFKLSCLIAYYPTRIPEPRGRFPGGVQVLVHLAGDEVGVVKRSQMVGIQGKKRVTRKAIDRGMGTGGLVRMAYTAFSYDAEPGFAEEDLDEYDKIMADLAWDRSLATARRAFRWDTNVMGVVEENMESKFFAQSEGRLMKTYTTQHTPHVSFMSTLVGGIGHAEIAKFYGDFFFETNPPSLEVTLISRTNSADRVVDELHVTFDHTQGMPWILPGVPPTNKTVEIMIISIVTLRGGKVYHERIYWDQASVLTQVGLLNPNLVPKKMKGKGMERLPIVGGQAARRVLEGGYGDDEGEADNELLPEFWDEDDEDDEDEDEDEEDEGNGDEDEGTEGDDEAEDEEHEQDNKVNGTQAKNATPATHENIPERPKKWKSRNNTPNGRGKPSKAASVEDAEEKE